MQGFKEFALKGNVLDTAAGITIGAAFTTISLVDDVLMPRLGVLMGGQRLRRPAHRPRHPLDRPWPRDGGASVIAYGNSLTF